jgi:hypothetical protein
MPLTVDVYQCIHSSEREAWMRLGYFAMPLASRLARRSRTLSDLRDPGAGLDRTLADVPGEARLIAMEAGHRGSHGA